MIQLEIKRNSNGKIIKGTVLNSIIKSFEIADKVQRPNFKNVVEEYSTSFMKNNTRAKDKLPRRNTEFLFYQELDFIRLTNYGKKQQAILNNHNTIKLKESNQYVHNDLMWDFVANYIMYTSTDCELMREGATMKGTISDVVMDYKEYKLFIEAETGTQGADKVADKIVRYDRELAPNEIMIVYSAKPKKLEKLNWSNQIILLDSNKKFKEHIPTLESAINKLTLYSNIDTLDEKLTPDLMEGKDEEKLDWSRINTKELVNYWRQI